MDALIVPAGGLRPIPDVTEDYAADAAATIWSRTSGSWIPLTRRHGQRVAVKLLDGRRTMRSALKMAAAAWPELASTFDEIRTERKRNAWRGRRDVKARLAADPTAYAPPALVQIVVKATGAEGGEISGGSQGVRAIREAKRAARREEPPYPWLLDHIVKAIGEEAAAEEIGATEAQIRTWLRGTPVPEDYHYDVIFLAATVLSVMHEVDEDDTDRVSSMMRAQGAA